MTDRYSIGIDLGGTKIESVLLDSQGETVTRFRVTTPRRRNEEKEYDAVRGAVHAAIERTLTHVPPGAETTIGIGIPGAIDDKTGRVQNANTTGLIGRPFKADLERLLARPVGMDNDANCFTLAESLAGAAKGYGLVFGIIMGTGCGGGISVNGRIHRGGHGIAGEWGHVCVDPRGVDCYCGKKGCIETKISGGGVSRAFHQRFGEHLSMEAITEGYRLSDPRCVGVFEQFLDDFGRCLGGLISILDPDAVVLGGGLSNIAELYTIGLEKVRRYAFHDNLRTPILKNALGDSAGVFGAAWIGR